MIDWPALLQKHDIDFVRHGQHELSTRCPFCGEADTGYHMAVSLRSRGWHCWRNRAHRGKAPQRLFAALLGVSVERAVQILGLRGMYGLVPSDGGLLEKAEQLLNVRSVGSKTLPRKLTMPVEFKPLKSNAPRPYRRYMNSRGYSNEEINSLHQRYDLRFALRGAYNYRIIFPIYTRDGLVIWTGRTVAEGPWDHDIIRYKSLSTDPEKAALDQMPPALVKITDCLFGEQTLFEGGKALVLCEGPFDALRIDWAGHREGIRGACLFGKGLSMAQIETLIELAPLYTSKVLMLDSDTELESFQLQQRLSPLGFKSQYVPKPFKDPGEMPNNKVLELLR